MDKKWYQQYWPWFLLLLPLAAVIASLVTVYIFSKNPVALVSENYYKEGKGVNQDLSRLRQADALGISAKMQISHAPSDLTKQGKTVVTVLLDKGRLAQFMPIKVQFRHRTLPERDIEQILTPDAQDGYYYAFIPATLSGPWHIEVASFDDSWELATKAQLPSPGLITLVGKP